jgi:hypothetical protein
VASRKTAVIEYLFDQRYDAATGQLTSDVVTFDDIAAAIRATGAGLSTGNVANFWKDIIRTASNANWPAGVLARGFTGDDAIGAGARASFRFIPLPAGQTTPFPPPPVPSPALLAEPMPIQSVSLPMPARLLGREDETWLAQIAYRLHVVETHFAVVSPRDVIEVDFLQTSIKLRSGEVDVAYRLTQRDGSRFLVAVEAKGRRDVVWVPQLARAAQALAVRAGPAAGVAGVIPFAIKIVGTSLVHTIEFDAGGGTQLTVVSEAVMRLLPPVEGIT